jgi:hypothetical protein
MNGASMNEPSGTPNAPNGINGLVDRARDFFAAQGRDHPLDLPPVAEARDIALVAALLGADRCLESSVVAIELDQLGRIGKRGAAVDEGAVHATASSPTAVSQLPTNVVNGALTMFVRCAPLWHGTAMRGSRTRAGGCFLTICILAGFPVGLAIGNPMKGVLIGTGVGIALAAMTWLFDSRRGR